MLREGPMIDAHRVTLASEDDFEGWRDAARDLAEAGVPPEAIVWRVEGGTGDLFGTDVSQPKAASFAVPRAFVDIAKSVVCHSDPERFALLYALLLRLKTNRHALDDEADPLVRRANELAKAVRDPDTLKRFEAMGIDPVGNTPEQYAVGLKDDIAYYANAVKVSGAKID